MLARTISVVVNAAFLAVAGTAAASAPASHGDAARTTEPGLPAQIYAAQSDGPAILYVNGCFGTGCRVSASSTSSSLSNTSSLLKGNANVLPYQYGEAHFAQVVDCVREIFEPFGIAVTDVDPGAVPHFESIVGGSSPESLGFPSQVGGVAPRSCGVIPNAVSFVFPEQLDGVRQTCETIAHEAAHTWGLEHSFMCEDTMTYLSGCGAKEFEDADVMCGEDEARACTCGGTTQNSYRRLIETFGAANPTPPTVELMSPVSGTRVDPRFAVTARASDDTAVRLVELWIDGKRVASKDAPPWTFTAPELGNGLHMVEVRALDDVYTPASAMAEVRVGSFCTSNDDCAGHEVCAGDVCVSGPRAAGGLGTACQYNGDCESGMCLDVAGGDWRCVMPCGQDGATCPDGFSCEAVGVNDPACVLDEPAGCRTGGRSPVGAWALLVAAIALVSRRRRW